MFLKITLFNFLLAESSSIVYMGLFFFIHLSPHWQYVYFHFFGYCKVQSSANLVACAFQNIVFSNIPRSASAGSYSSLIFFLKAGPFSPLDCFYLLPATSTINGFPSLCIFTVSSLQNVHDGLSHWCRVIPHYALDWHTSLIDHDVQQFGYFLKQCDKNLQLKVFFL